MATTSPTHWGWFVAHDQALLTDDEVRAYGLPDYSGPRKGGGTYVDLYADPERDQPIGRLWAAGGDRAGVVHVENEDDVWYTRLALNLRLLKEQGLDSLAAFAELASQYAAGPVYEGPLDNIADPDIEANDTI